jgi:ammonium transporter
VETRLQVMCLAAVCCMALGTGFGALAQEAATPSAETTTASADPATAAPAAVVPATTEAAASEPAPAEAAPAPSISKPDTVWVLMSAALVIFMTLPGLALFYGGLVRSKNVLSVLMQVMTVFSMILVLWVIYGYSLAFNGGNAFIGNLDKLFLKGVTKDSLAATFTAGVSLPNTCSWCSSPPSPASPVR